MSFINHTNYEQIYDDYCKKHDRLHLAFESMKKQIDNNNFYYNEHTLFFIYYSIKKQNNLDDFSQLIKYIYTTTDSGLMEYAFVEFFDLSHAKIPLLRYIKMPLEEKNSLPIKNKINFCFIDSKNEQFVIDKNTLPYLEKMCEHIDHKHVDALISSYFYPFLTYFYQNLYCIKSLLDIIDHNPVFETSKIHKSFFNTFITHISNNVYHYSNHERKNIFNALSENITHFHDKYFHALFNEKDIQDVRVMDINSYLLTFSPFFGIENVIDTINNRYQQYLLLGNYNDEQQLYSANSISHSIDVHLVNFINFTEGFEQSIINNINIEKSILENFVYLKYILLHIEKNNEMISLGLLDYLNKEIEKEKDWPIYTEDDDPRLKKPSEMLKVENIKHMLDYARLDKNIVDKKVTQKKNKI